MARRRKRPASIGAPMQPLERLAAGILEQQRRSTAFAGQRERPRRPCGVELVPQFIFVGKAIEAGRRRALRGGQHGQHGAAAAVVVRAPPAAEDAFAILPQDLTAVIRIGAFQRMQHHLSHSGVGLLAAFGRR